MGKDVFISYSRKDTATADTICKALDKAGITYFIDRQGIDGGMEFPKVLAEEINECKVFLFLGSKYSYESKFTNSEVTYAFNKKQKTQILPYLIDNTPLPSELEFVFSSINIRNIKDHPVDSILVQDIKAILARSIRPSSINKPAKRSKLVPVILVCAVLAILAVALWVLKPNNATNTDNAVVNQVEEKTSGIFENEASIKKFLTTTVFVSRTGDTMTFTEGCSAAIMNSVEMPISSFSIENIKSNSADLMIEFGPTSKFVDILSKDKDGYNININGGGYKYYAKE